jgi:hypothetical protein
VILTHLKDILFELLSMKRWAKVLIRCLINKLKAIHFIRKQNKTFKE